jgi:hypothetical protein
VAWLKDHVEGRRFEQFICLLICLNGVCHILEGKYPQLEKTWAVIEIVFLSIYCLEVLAKAISAGWARIKVKSVLIHEHHNWHIGPDHCRIWVPACLKGPWFLFDLVVVGISVIMTFNQRHSADPKTSAILLRLFRFFRVLRVSHAAGDDDEVFAQFKSINFYVRGLLKSVISILCCVCVLFVFIFLCAVIADELITRPIKEGCGCIALSCTRCCWEAEPDPAGGVADVPGGG